MLGVLDERQPRSVTYDAAADALDLDLTGDAATKARAVRGNLLLDAKGFVVGVDLRDDAHVVVMIGPHEAVAKQVPARMEIFASAAAPSEVGRVRIAQAKSVARGDGTNPYV